MKPKLKKQNKLIGVLMVLLTLVSTLFTSTPVFASELQFPHDSGYHYRGISINTGQSEYNNIFMLAMDGRITFCVESGILAYEGEGFIPEEYISPKKDILSKIAYYGYTKTNQTGYDYAVTQVMIWEELGDVYEYSNIPSYFERKAEILELVSRHDEVPSWNNETVEVQVGQSVALDDSNGLLSSMSLTSNSTNANVENNGNTLTITPTADSNDGVISYQKYPDFELGTSILYNKPGEQKIVEFHLEHNVFASINLRVTKLGNVRVQKIDEDTGQPLAEATIRFTYNGKEVDVVTDSDGFAELNDLPQGTQVTITELLAPDGFHNKGIHQTVTIEPNNTVQVILHNKAQMGVLSLTKLGNKAVNLKQTESDFGDVYSFDYDYRPLAGVTYDIVATEDILVAGTVHASSGDVIATVTTDESGQLTNVPHLYLGKYKAVEQSAPFGYVIAPYSTAF